MSFDKRKLFQLLPALYRTRDAGLAQNFPLLTPAEQARLYQLNGQGALSPAEALEFQTLQDKQLRGPLESLLMVIGEQMAAMDEDLKRLYDDLFIETCADWVVPYIGDLIGYQPVPETPFQTYSSRPDVAHTLSFRRRKGTAAMLEELARDVTGWHAHAVEFFKLLCTTQYLNHLRPDSRQCPDLRQWEPLQYAGGAFDPLAHTTDVRRIVSGRGRYNIPQIGIFLWRLQAYLLAGSPAQALDARRYRFSPLGRDMALFNRPQPPADSPYSPVTPLNVPLPLNRRVVDEDVATAREQGEDASAYYGPAQSFALYVNGSAVPASQVCVCDLEGDDTAGWANLPAAGSALYAIDPALGRIGLPANPATPVTSVQVSYCQGFGGDLGGGPYPRSLTFQVQNPTSVLPFPDTESPARYTTLQDALAYAGAHPDAQGQMAVEITDNGTYAETNLTVSLPNGVEVELRSADGKRPTLLLQGPLTVSGGEGSEFYLNGLLIAAQGPPAPAPTSLIHVTASGAPGTPGLGRMLLTHLTLVPGLALDTKGKPLYPVQPALVAEVDGLQLEASLSILGTVLCKETVTLSLTDSILDSTGWSNTAFAGLDGKGVGGNFTATQVTAVGKIHAGVLEVSNSLLLARLSTGDAWAAPVWAERRQEGCVRFSYLPSDAKLPRQYECQSDNGLDAGGLVPLFASLTYGDPEYAQLQTDTPDALRRGADDEGEMGAYHFLLGPQRETALRVRLAEYLPIGLEAGLIYES